MEVSERVVLREVTDDEIRRYRENGWVKLKQLVTSEEAALLRERIRAMMGDDAGGGMEKGKSTAASKLGPLAVDNATGEVVDTFFFEFSHSPQMGRLASRLLGRSGRYFVDEAFVKRPVRSGDGSGPTRWHQDLGATERSPWSAPDQLNLWLALIDIPPERGPMRFVAPKDIDADVLKIIDQPDESRPYEEFLSETYVELERKGVLSENLGLRAGDATVHSSSTLHSAPLNTSDAPRWVYLMTIFAADLEFTGDNSSWPMDGVQGMEVGKPFVDHRYRLLPS
jgi:hypothetical protein